MTMHARGSDPDPLGAVLRAARAPAHPEELTGEHQAVAAFRAAASAPPRRSLLARALTVKAMVIGGLVASTGVVVATAGGALPWPSTVVPADPPAVTEPASVPAVPPSAGPDTRTTDQVTPPSDTAPPVSPPGRPTEIPGKSKNNKDGGPPSTNPGNPPAVTPSKGPRTPASNARGAATVPPSGAIPPSPGS